MKLHRAFRRLNDFNYSTAERDGETWVGEREHCSQRGRRVKSEGGKSEAREGGNSFNRHFLKKNQQQVEICFLILCKLTSLQRATNQSDTLQ